MKLRKKNLWLVTLGALWMGGVMSGMWLLWAYSNTPGQAAQPSALWPVESCIERTPGRATLVLVAHPRCPCTRASLGELALLMARCQELVTASVLFYQPEDFADEWAQTDLWQSASTIPGVQVKRDRGGVEARRFQAATSGQVLLYDARGSLLFSGGITGGRGHAGDNAGRSAIVSLLTEGAAERANTFVFGCSLLDSRLGEDAQVCHQ
jgi:hypothetical protein